jgi:hypothetical protein
MHEVQCCVAAYCFASHTDYVMLRKGKGGTTAAVMRPLAKENFAMILDLVSRARNSLDKRRRYNQLVNEIQGLSDRDLADFRASRSEMLYQARKQIYG